MSSITLSSSVRQNLLSLQSTADLLATTQNRLATGKKVTSALDNPTNFFTAASLDARAGDINNLLDGIGNGVQVLQAANTGITSIQKLVDTAKSIANQALQTTVGYTKSSVTTSSIAGATAQNLLGTTASPTDATYAGSTAPLATSTSAYVSTTATAGSQLYSASATNATGATLLSGLTDSGGVAAGIANNDTLTINGKTITFQTGSGALAGSGTAYTLGIGSSLTQLAAALDTLQGTSGTSVAGGQITLKTGTAADLAVTGSTGVLAKLGLSASGANTAARTGGVTTTPALATTTRLGGTVPAGTAAITSAFTTSDTLTVNGKTIAFYDTGAGGSAGSAANTTYLDLNSATVSSLTGAIDAITGGTSTFGSGKISLHTGVGSDLSVSSTNAAALTALGLSGGVTQARTAGAASASGSLGGLTLNIAATGGGTATAITFGTGTGQVSTLNQLNASLAANNLQATIDSTGALTITTTNDAASSNIGAITGTAATTVGKAFNGVTLNNAVVDANSQATRAGFVSQYNAVIAQIATTAQDSSYNGVNLLGGDTLKLTFNETGKSSLSITGVNFAPAGLGLSALTSGTDFLDNSSANKVLTNLTNASTALRSQAASFGSNLSIVQIRQDFSKNLINVLQTGSSNLTLADTNEEAANSQALSTRQSIAVSALALANTSQQSVLQLLR